MFSSIEDAEVIWWSMNRFAVRCPYCEKVHTHGLTDQDLNGYNSDGKHTRSSHCHPGGYYVYHFPFEQHSGSTAYEIDKQNARFVSVSTKLNLEDEMQELENELVKLAHDNSRLSAEDHSELRFLDDAQETITFDIGDGDTFEQKKIKHMVAMCVEGRAQIVEDYIRTSPEAEIFLHGRNEKGNTTLITAACEESVDMVALLVNQGAKLNAVNKYGRTALMEAALWGRLGSVELLLRHGAYPDLLDSKQQRAIDLAEVREANKTERHIRAGGGIGYPPSPPVYKEDSFQRDEDRRRIVKLLSPHQSRNNIQYGRPPSGADLDHYSFKRFSQNEPCVIFRGPHSVLPITKPEKSVARLERGALFPAISAMSGYSHPELSSVRINGKAWTDEVQYIADVIGHQFCSDKPSMYYASHAEKQLLAYFVSRHCFLPKDGDGDQQLEDHIEELDHDIKSKPAAAVQQVLELESRRSCIQERLEKAQDDLDLKDIKKVNEYHQERASEWRTKIGPIDQQLCRLEQHPDVVIWRNTQRVKSLLEQKLRAQHSLMLLSKRKMPVPLTEAVIFVSSPGRMICSDCRRFLNKVNAHFGLTIQVHDLTK